MQYAEIEQMKILIFGLPGTGKTTLAEPLAKLIKGVHVTGTQIRKKYEGHDKSNWDFSEQGRLKQAHWMKHISDGIELAERVAVIDFVCPTVEMREIINADFTIWMDTTNGSLYKDTLKMFQPPKQKTDVDYHVAQWFDDTHTQLVPIIDRWMRLNDCTPIAYISYKMGLV